MSINKAILMGVVAEEADIRNLPSGSTIGSFRLKTTESWRDKSGAMQEKSQWHTVTTFQKELIDTMSTSLGKGSRVFLEGQIQNRKWKNKSGQEQTSTEIVLGFGAKLVALDKEPGHRDDNDDEHF